MPQSVEVSMQFLLGILIAFIVSNCVIMETLMLDFMIIELSTEFCLMLFVV